MGLSILYLLKSIPCLRNVFLHKSPRFSFASRHHICHHKSKSGRHIWLGPIQLWLVMDSNSPSLRGEKRGPAAWKMWKAAVSLPHSITVPALVFGLAGHESFSLKPELAFLCSGRGRLVLLVVTYLARDRPTWRPRSSLSWAVHIYCFPEYIPVVFSFFLYLFLYHLSVFPSFWPAGLKSHHSPDFNSSYAAWGETC